MIYNIIEELNLENGSNYKKAVLKKYEDNELLKRVLKMTYDRVSYTYGITMKNVHADTSKNTETLEWGLDLLENELVTRNTTGNAAISLVENILEAMSETDRIIIERILDRDLKIRLGRTEINKVFKNLIVKSPYTRCEIGTEKNILKNMPIYKDGNFKNKVYSQLKMDGTFRRAIIDGENVEITSRPGIVSSFPLIEKQLLSLGIEGYVFIGEMTLRGEQNRNIGNGIINSDNIPHENVLYTVWDMIPINEFSMTKNEIKAAEKAGTLSLYEDRFNLLKELLDHPLQNVELVESRIIKNMKEAYEHFQEVTERGDEGTVIKSYDMTHKDGNSKKQLKCKINFEIDARVVGFIEGKKGTSREKTFGSIVYETDDGKIKGSVSGFTDEQLEDFNSRRNEIIGRVIEIEANNLTKGRNNDYYALSHPRFIRLRDKNTTDTLERAQESLKNAMTLATK